MRLRGGYGKLIPEWSGFPIFGLRIAALVDAVAEKIGNAVRNEIKNVSKRP